MKKIKVRFLVENTARMCSIKMPIGVTGTQSREYIAKVIPQMKDIDYFMARESRGGELTIIDEEETLMPNPPSKDTIIQLTPRKKKFELFCANMERMEAILDLTVTVGENIEHIVTNGPDHYTFCFRPSNEPDIPRLVCPSKLLIEQGWRNESLYLIRVVTVGD